MKDDPVINLATRFGPILKAAFPNEHSVTRFDVANALAEAALSAQQAAGEAVEICPTCNGAGGDNNVWTCPRCNGSGGTTPAGERQ